MQLICFCNELLHINFLLQEELERLFPNWTSIRKHENVIIFAFGLTEQPQPLIQLLYKRLTCYLKEGNGFGATEKFLLWLQKETKQDIGLDFVHNQYFNYTTVDDPKLFLHSRFYLFDDQTPDSETIKISNEGSASQSSTLAECSIDVQIPSAYLNVLKILQEIQNNHKINVSAFSLMWPEPHLKPNETLSITEKYNTAVLVKSALKMQRNIKVFNIAGCYLTQPSFKHLVKQLRDCREMSSLYFINVQQNLPVLLGEVIGTMTSLKNVNLESSWMTSRTAEAVLFGLSQCRGLEILHLSDCKLTSCLDRLFENPNHTGFPSLKTLGLSQTKLNKADLSSIFGAVTQNKLRQLEKLFLAKNEQLGGCLPSFLPLKIPNRRYPVFQFLKNLDLNGTNLSQGDIDHLGQILRLKKLPSLIVLDLGQNKLTGCIRNLLGDTGPHPGLVELERMGLESSALDRNDLGVLSKILSNPKMQKCTSLDISGNVLKGMIGILFEEFGLPYLEALYLQKCSVETEDLMSLTDGVRKGKMPRLKRLLLRNIDFHGKEDAVKNLVTACVDYFKQHRMSVLLSLDEVSSPDKFKDTINSLCKGSLVSIHLLKTISKTANSGSFAYNVQVSGTFKPGTNVTQINF